MTDETGEPWQCPKDGTVMQAARTALAGVALPDVQGHVHRHRGHASGATAQVVANPDEHPLEPVGEGRGPAEASGL